jgi:hypothetical protein
MKPVASVRDHIKNGSRFSALKKGNRQIQMSIVQPLREKLLKLILHNTVRDSSVSANVLPQRSFYFTSSDRALDEPHAVFAFGNFFGNADIFIVIPWQYLQLRKPSKPLNIDIVSAWIISRKFGRSNRASLEIKRDASGCIKIIARKNPH